MPVRSQNPSGGTVIVASLFLSLMMGLSVFAGYRMALQDTRARVVTDRGLDIELVKRSDGRIYLIQEASLRFSALKRLGFTPIM